MSTVIIKSEEDQARLQLRLDQYKLRKRNNLQFIDPSTGSIVQWNQNSLFYAGKRFPS